MPRVYGSRSLARWIGVRRRARAPSGGPILAVGRSFNVSERATPLGDEQASRRGHRANGLPSSGAVAGRGCARHSSTPISLVSGGTAHLRGRRD